METEKIKVIVVDDSFLMRRIISDIINSDGSLEVVARAKDGRDALEKVLSLSPDVVTLDINLPDINGIDVLQEIMKKRPTRVIMLSAYTRSGASATMRALELGAVDFIAKPAGEISLGLDKLKSEIIAKIKTAAKINLDKYLDGFRAKADIAEDKKKVSDTKKLVVIGASTGGPKAVLDIMRDIPVDIQASFLIVQHMPKGFTQTFAERIGWQSGIRAKEAEESDSLAPGRVFVAPAGFHLVLEEYKDEVKIKLNQDPPVNFVRPSIDVTMLSTARIFGNNVIGVILTGMGKDGFEGVKKIKECGGKVIVQDEATSVVWGMPGSVARAGLADSILPLSNIAQELLKYIR
ncbi:MAG: chemotaxis response regulator protein-glutamate methylesterase [Candidatus Omnitrophica bacterium]|jgi:two-component system chemotaxis response regulator CheB|nr:chemotaxis response regulator protein-glutamate methylesterase [Candidatus Omnitrophota bacterium]MDD5079272.1 chemotaxis response regulator protein-glutamate methylesterase [Candidatus Omnitrophota bacterium]